MKEILQIDDQLSPVGNFQILSPLLGEARKPEEYQGFSRLFVFPFEFVPLYVPLRPLMGRTWRVVHFCHEVTFSVTILMPTRI